MVLPRNLQLDIIAATLEGFEEDIIFSLVDRVQYRVNGKIYRKGRSGFRGESRKSLFSIRLRCQEEMDARFGRYCVAEERPFTRRLPRPRRIAHLPDPGLALRDFNTVNLTADILRGYRGLVRRLCESGDDGHYGSSVEHDVSALQAISRRIHYGAMFVAESKYRTDPKTWRAMIDARDEKGMMRLLTRPKVENAVIARVREKVAAVQKQVNLRVRRRLDPETVVRYYREHVIPLTKKGEIIYLLHRRKDTREGRGRHYGG
jgi:chorismate mutase